MCVFVICMYLHLLCSVCILVFIVLLLFCVFFMFCSCFVVIVVLCIFIFVCTSVGLLPPGESPIAVSNNNNNNNNNNNGIINEGTDKVSKKSRILFKILGTRRVS